MPREIIRDDAALHRLLAAVLQQAIIDADNNFDNFFDGETFFDAADFLKDVALSPRIEQALRQHQTRRKAA